MSGDKIRQLEAWVESRPLGLATQKDDGPFFSILVRTMGDRNDLLYEALISIAAQTFESYEVLVLAHRCPDLGPLRALVAGLPAFFGEKVRLIPIEEGTRCRPLNVGLDEARGRFIGFLDDDDLMLANHLETVRSGVEGAEALHTFGAVRSIETEGDRTFPYTTSKISIDFTMPFSAFRQMSQVS